MSFHRLLLLTLFDLQYSVCRTKGLFFLVPFFIGWIAVLYKFDQEFSQWWQQQGIFFITGLLDFETAKKLIIDNPPILSFYFIFNMNSMPLFAILAGYDQFSSDLGCGYFRMLNNRCSRLEIFLSRYFSAMVILSSGLLIAGLITAVAAITHVDQSPGSIFQYLAVIEIKMILYGAALVAFAGLVSTIARSSTGSLFLGGFLYMALLVLIFMAAMVYENATVFNYLLPAFFKPELFNIDWSEAIKGMLAMPAYIVSYGMLAWVIFRTRSL